MTIGNNDKPFVRLLIFLLAAILVAGYLLLKN